VDAHPESKIVLIGQAPGIRVHESGIPWNDHSGVKLRKWLNVKDDDFYNPKIFGIIPMGFCYPGTGKSGDLAPRKECAPEWHQKLFNHFVNDPLIILIGNYVQKYYLKNKAEKTLTETVKNFKEYLPKYFVLPHPSPRNNIWMKKNQWFESDVLPTLKVHIQLKRTDQV